MTNNNKAAVKAITPEFRVSFPVLFEPQLPHNAKPTDKPRYSLTMLFPEGADLSELKAAAANAAAAKFGPDKARWPKGMRSPFRDGAEKEYSGYGPGVTFIKAWTFIRPAVVNRQREPITDSTEVYAGCYAKASLVASGYNSNGNSGVRFALQNVQKIRDGEPFSGRSSPEDDFSPIGPAAGDGAAGNDEMPF